MQPLSPREPLVCDTKAVPQLLTPRNPFANQREGPSRSLPSRRPFPTKVPCQQCAGRKQGGNCQIIGSFHHLADNSPPNPAHLMMPSRNTEPKDQVKLVRVPEMFSPSPPHLFQMMKTTRFLAGLPQFFCHRSSQRGAACTDKCAQASRATRTLGRSCRSDPMPCSSANPSSPCSALPPQTPPACSWQLLDEHGESFRIASKSNG